MTFAILEISRNPNIQAKLYNEIKTILDEGSNAEFESLSKFSYLDRVIKETLRFHTVVHMVARETTKNVSILGYNFPKEVNFLIYIFTIN